MAAAELSAHSARDNSIPARARWDDLIARFEANERAAVPVGADPDSLIDLAGNFIDQFTDTPAPDPAALRWKLDCLLDDRLYAEEFVAQTIADCHGILGGACASFPFDPADWITRFTAAGGTYTITEVLFSLGWPIWDRTDEQREEARRIIGELGDDADNREAVRAYVLTKTRRV